MGFSDFITTREGHLAIAENLAGGGIFEFVEIVLGDGKITTQAPEALLEVISPIHTVSVASAELKQGVTAGGETANYVLVKTHFKTADIGTSFYFREIGVYARVGEGEKRLVCYNNAYDLADYIDATATETQDRTLAIPVYVGSVSDIAIQISEDLTYVLSDEFEAHKTDNTLHLPKGGAEGQFLGKTKDGVEFISIEIPEADVSSEIDAHNTDENAHSGVFAEAEHSHAAGDVTSGTFAATSVKAKSGTDYTTARVRNIKASTSTVSSLTNGDIHLTYE